jgi:hypothetical protein
MTTFYVATDRNGLRFAGCAGHGSVKEAAECMKSAGDYVYAVEDGVGRELTVEEQRNVYDS